MAGFNDNNDNKRTGKTIFLIGMPAAGKTYWGKKIAETFGVAFVDLDEYIVQAEGRSVAGLFEQEGENAFREKERRHLMRLIHTVSSTTVIACGGGTPCYFENINHMREAGIVIYIDADVPALAGNIARSSEQRPLLAGQNDINAYLDKLLDQRQPFYRQAHHILQAKNISIATFAQILNHG